MSPGTPHGGWTTRFEKIILTSVLLTLGVVVLVAAIELWVLLAHGLYDRALQIGSVMDLQEAVQRAFAGALLVVLGLELMETLRLYASEHRVRLETILIVAIVAMGRHVIQLNLEHQDGVWLLGVGALFLALTGGYFLVKRAG
jgi:uncharacterized membrane protein (DUF373 family)